MIEEEINTVTPEEAGSQMCPLVRDKTGTCHGGGCMMWGWWPLCDDPGRKDEAPFIRGYCGLAGKPV